MPSSRMIQTDNLVRPDWIRVRAPGSTAWRATDAVLQRHGVATVCREASCPNQAECWAHRSATFLIGGDTCTRGCSFCGIHKMAAPPLPADDEPERLAQAIAELGLEFVVITSVDRDDLPDEGASHWRACLDAVARTNPNVGIEVLIPDFHARPECLEQILTPGVRIFGHNLETIPRLYRRVRGGSDYARSLDVLRWAAEHGGKRVVKTSIMLGVGETDAEADVVLADAHEAGATAICIGQYLPPNPRRLPVQRYVSPEEFERWGQRATELGFTHVASGPFVRSSYRSWQWVKE